MKEGRARAFLALPLGAELGPALLMRVRAALGGEAGYRWPRAEGLHATVLFLGDVEGAFLERLWQEVQRGLEGTRALELRLRRAGAFPARGRERVLWVSFVDEPPGAYAALRGRVLDAAERAGFDVAGERERPDRPHVTVARPRGRARVPEAFHALDPDLAWRAEALVLFESIGADGPPLYRPLATLALEAPGPG